MDRRRGYRPVIGWLPERDKDGEEITPERFGPGGARRENGTLCALVEHIDVLPYGEPTYSERPRELSPQAQRMIREFVDVTWNNVIAPIGRATWAEFQDWRLERKLRRIDERRRRRAAVDHRRDDSGATTAEAPATQDAPRLHLVIDGVEPNDAANADVA